MLTPAVTANLFSTYYRSRLFDITRANGKRFDCENMRDGCKGQPPAKADCGLRNSPSWRWTSRASGSPPAGAAKPAGARTQARISSSQSKTRWSRSPSARGSQCESAPSCSVKRTTRFFSAGVETAS